MVQFSEKDWWAQSKCGDKDEDICSNVDNELFVSEIQMESFSLSYPPHSPFASLFSNLIKIDILKFYILLIATCWIYIMNNGFYFCL